MRPLSGQDCTIREVTTLGAGTPETPYPRLIVGRTYRLVFARAASADTTGSQGERVLEENNCIFEEYVGMWWGFIGADGIQRIIVNPAMVAYIEIHNDGSVSDNFGTWG